MNLSSRPARRHPQRKLRSEAVVLARNLFARMNGAFPVRVRKDIGALKGQVSLMPVVGTFYDQEG